MNGDVLLSWMTHIGEGSWAKFRGAVEELAGCDVDLPALCRALRIRLSDLSIADFFIEDRQQWRTLPTVLGGLAVHEPSAILCGGRTPILVDAFKTAADEHGCCFEAEAARDCPTTLRIAGDPDALASVARRIGISFASNFAAGLAGNLLPIPVTLDTASKEPAPLNWSVRSFDFKTRVWVDELLPNAPCEYTPRFGHPKHFVHRKRGKLLRISKRESMYAAALLNGLRLIEHDVTNRRLSVPLFAPLPILYSRAASLCSGRPPEILDGRINYSDVPPELGAIVMVAAGQPHPRAGIWASYRE